MKILIHLCCGPCSLYPLAALRRQGHAVEGFFFNPNIHPFKEFRRRINAVDEMARQASFKVEVVREYGMRDYLRQVVGKEDRRCPLCYEMRLAATVKQARKVGAEAFTTTLLYSKYQQHETIRRLGEKLGAEYEVPFYYEDFRVGWQEGIDRSLVMGLYRQPYCGCIYSEQERYDKRWRRRQRDLPADSLSGGAQAKSRPAEN